MKSSCFSSHRQLSDIHSDLDERVSSIRRRGQEEQHHVPNSTSSTSSFEDGGLPSSPPVSPSSTSNIAQDLEAAGAAWAELREVLREVDVAVRREERQMASTAGWLHRRGEQDFEKMSRGALDRMRAKQRIAEKFE